MLHISNSIVLTIMHSYLNLRHVCVRWLPKLQMPEQKLMYVEVSKELQHLVVEQARPTFHRSSENSIISDDKRVGFITMIPKVNRRTLEIALIFDGRVVWLAGKVMVISFFDYYGMVYQHEVLLQTSYWAVLCDSFEDPD